jgi:rRNA maturation RNase YbeY
LVSGFELRNPEKYKDWIKKIISLNFNKLVGDISFVFMEDDSLHSMNMEFLKHDTYTDIITFDNSLNEDIISGEVYISIDRVKENSRINEHDLYAELERVMIHGVLHLLGYGDENDEEKAVMRSHEDYCLNLLP